MTRITVCPKNTFLHILSASVAICFLISVAIAQCSNPGFDIGKRNFPNLLLGAIPQDARDYNGDGKADVILRYSISGNAYFAVSFGDGAGGLTQPVSYLAGATMWTMVVGDINADGKPDLITNHLSTSSKVWLNNGAGVFESPRTLVNPIPYPLLLVDLNGDGKGDLVSGVGSFQVRLGDGTGEFSQGSPIFDPPVSYGLTNIVAGDFNGDTKIDLAASYIHGTSNVTKLIVYSGDGAGNFVANPASDTGSFFIFYLTADYNGDGKLDLGGANPQYQGQAPMVGVLLNNGAGGFTQTNYPVVSGRSVYNIKGGDFNGDTKADIAIEMDGIGSPYYGRGYGSILYGNGSGGFVRRDHFKPKLNLDVVADFNNDGTTDAITWTYATDIAPFSFRTMFGTCTPKNITNIIDYDGDGLTDQAVWRPSDGTWLIRYSLGGLRIQQWGAPGDVPTQGDYDGDGKSDLAVFRPSTGSWYFINSHDNSQTAVHWGLNGDKPVQGDYDGDGKTDIAVYRPSTGGWYVLCSFEGGFASYQFGIVEDRPVQSDFDGDGKTDVAVFRPSSGVWYGLNSSDGSLMSLQFGTSEDKPVPGDYDGDGKSDIAVFRPSTGIWHIFRSGNSTPIAIRYGESTDIPVPGDYADLVSEVTRDGIIEMGVRRSSNTAFYSYPYATPVFWAASGDVPVMTPYRIE